VNLLISICLRPKGTATTIQDVQPDVFDNLVEFINTGCCEVEILVLQKFFTVKKHNIKLMKGIFIETMQNKLTVNKEG
jgi:hypothetical protein